MKKYLITLAILLIAGPALGKSFQWRAVPGIKLMEVLSDTTDGSTTFTDTGDYGAAITRAATTHEDTQAKFGATSFYQTGVNSYLRFPDNAYWVNGTADYGFQAWLYVTNPPESASRILMHSNSTATWRHSFYLTSTETIMGCYGQQVALVWQQQTGAFAAINNAWHHIRMTRTSGVCRAYLDNVQITYTTNNACGYSWGNVAGYMYIGYSPYGTHREYAGYLDELVYFRNNKGRMPMWNRQAPARKTI